MITYVSRAHYPGHACVDGVGKQGVKRKLQNVAARVLARQHIRRRQCVAEEDDMPLRRDVVCKGYRVEPGG
eukprot:4766814-Pleurochrysis_carterae.AAC.1